MGMLVVVRLDEASELITLLKEKLLSSLAKDEGFGLVSLLELKLIISLKGFDLVAEKLEIMVDIVHLLARMVSL